MMPRLRRIIVTATVGAMVLVTATTSYAAHVALSCPPTVQASQQLATEITIDVGTTPLGAYSVAVTYDPAVVTIASIAGGNTAAFGGAPTTEAGSFKSGRTNVSAFQTSSLAEPTGTVSVARIRFDVAGASNGKSVIGLAIRDLFNTGATPIPAQATGCTVLVTPSS